MSDKIPLISNDLDVAAGVDANIVETNEYADGSAIVLDFGKVILNCQPPQAVLRARVSLPPLVVKDMIRVLTAAVEQHEAKHGRIATPNGPLVVFDGGKPPAA